MREKLIKVLDVIGSCNAKYCCDCEFAEDVEGCVRRKKEIIADHLIANGVTMLGEPIKMVIPEGFDEKRLIEMLHNAPLQILPCEPVQEWISVKDRLPEEKGDVLVCNAREGFVDTWRYLWNGVWLYDNNFWDTDVITHWMPLPSPPKGE